MASYELVGIEAAEIKNLTTEDLYSEALTDALYAIESRSEFHRVKGLILNRARALDIGAEYKAYLESVESDLDEYNDTAEFNHTTNFGLDGWQSLNCGQWIADRNGIRKKTSKLFASRSPIQPVEILENRSSGTEKVRLQFWKNGKTRYIIVDRNQIAAKANIVKLASQGVEVTSESSGQLVQYLSDVINLNPLPFSTAYSQMGWHENLFIPYDKEAVFDGEESNRYLFKAFTKKGKIGPWCENTAKYRKNIAVRLAMGASFASVLLEKIGALPFVFHLWGKTGTGKTVALMIAMSIWGNPKMGATVRTLNMTQNALIGQAAFLNSLPFAGDELQTIKERFDNYDKLIMRCTEGVDRGRMIDGQKAAETKRWKCAFLFTGEDKCTRPNSGAGVKNRCIEVEVDSELIENGNTAVNFVEDNYGHAGKLFIEKLQAINPESLRFEYNNMMTSLAEAAETEPKQAAAMAAILLADTLSRELFWQDEKPLSFREVMPFIASREEISIAERAYSFIIDIIAKNYAKFHLDDNRGEIWGGEKDGAVYFNATVLKDELQRAGFELSSVAQTWAKKGYIRKAKDGRTTHSTRVNGIKCRYVIIELPDDPEPDETDYDEVIDL